MLGFGRIEAYEGSKLVCLTPVTAGVFATLERETLPAHQYSQKLTGACLFLQVYTSIVAKMYLTVK